MKCSNCGNDDRLKPAAIFYLCGRYVCADCYKILSPQTGPNRVTWLLWFSLYVGVLFAVLWGLT